MPLPPQSPNLLTMLSLLLLPEPPKVPLLPANKKSRLSWLLKTLLLLLLRILLCNRQSLLLPITVPPQGNAGTIMPLAKTGPVWASVMAPKQSSLKQTAEKLAALANVEVKRLQKLPLTPLQKLPLTPLQKLPPLVITVMIMEQHVLIRWMNVQVGLHWVCA
jgi:hypothetical protein